MDILVKARAIYEAGKNTAGFSAAIDGKVSELLAEMLGESRVEKTTNFSMDGHSFTFEETSLTDTMRIFQAVQRMIANGAPTSSKTHVSFGRWQ